MILGIVIPTFNRANLLQKLLSQIFSYSSERLKISVVVVNDGSTDKTQEVLEGLSYVQNLSIINGDGSWWWTKSFNTGMVYCFDDQKVDYVLSLNDDVEIYEDFFEDLKRVVLELESKHGDRFIFNVGSKDISTGEYLDLGVVKNYSNPFKVYKNLLSDFVPSVDYIMVNHNHGRGLFLTRQVFTELGEMDYETFPQYLGDSDYGIRAFKAGFAQYFTCFPYLSSFVELTAKSAYEKHYNLKNFYKRATNKYSDAHIKTFYAFNRRHFRGLAFVKAMSADFLKINGGYLLRWAKSSLNKK